jgi:hypothetical protein
MPRVQQQVVPLSYGAQMVPPDPNANKPSSSAGNDNTAAKDEPPQPDEQAQTKMLQAFRTAQHAESQRIH